MPSRASGRGRGRGRGRGGRGGGRGGRGGPGRKPNHHQKKRKEAAKPTREEKDHDKSTKKEDKEWTSVGRRASKATNNTGSPDNDTTQDVGRVENGNSNGNINSGKFGVLGVEDDSEDEKEDIDERVESNSVEPKPSRQPVARVSDGKTANKDGAAKPSSVPTTKPIVPPTKKEESNFKINYQKLGRALRSPPKKTKVRGNKPKPLMKPNKLGRTSLGERRLDNKVLASLMQRDIVLYFDPRRCPVDPRVFQDLLGVYEVKQVDVDGFPIYERHQGKTERLIERFARCSSKAHRRLSADRGIFLANYSEFVPMRLFRIMPENNFYGWRIMPTEYVGGGMFGAFNDMITMNDQRPREREFWVEPNALFIRSDDAFMTWLPSTLNMDLPIFMGMAPVPMFDRAIELAEMPSSVIPAALRAPDFISWDKPLVLHANTTNDTQLIPSINRWMGVFVPGGRTYDGYPVWRRSLARTNRLARTVLVADEGTKKRLEILGISLHPSEQDTPACLYMYRHTLHVGTSDAFESNPTDGYTLRNKSVSPHEEMLLTQLDALFQYGREAFATWSCLLDSKWTEVSVAVTPEDVFENTLNLADLEEHFLSTKSSDHVQQGEEEVGGTLRNSVSQARKKGTKKKKKKKKKPASTSAALADPQYQEAVPDHESSQEPPAKADVSDATKSHDIDHTHINLPRETNKVDPVITQVILSSTDNARATSEIKVAPPTAEESPATTSRPEESPATTSKPEDKVALAKQQGDSLSEALKSESSPDDTALDQMLRCFFSTEGPSYLFVDEAVASSIYESSLQANDSTVSDTTKAWLRSCSDRLLTKGIEKDWKTFIVSVLTNCGAIKAESLIAVFEHLPRFSNDDINNRIGRAVSNISLASNEEASRLNAAFNKRVGKKTRAHLMALVNESLLKMKKTALRKKSSNYKGQQNVSARSESAPVKKRAKEAEEAKGSKVKTEDVTSAQSDVTGEMKRRIGLSIKWYENLLRQYQTGGYIEEGGLSDYDEFDDDEEVPEDAETREDDAIAINSRDPSEQRLSSREVVAALSKCEKLPEEEQANIISNVERSMDLKDWEDDTEWTVEMTEQAHKWFQRHLKRQHYLCDRVIRRLKILSTGRWPYVLCKPVRTSKSSSVKLYESKIDKSCRIIWEVAISFSPRRSKPNFSCCEQVIRLWDVVQDHDNLTRSIDLAVSRIEKSHMRGRECMIFSELENFDCNFDFNFSTDSSGQRLPRVFAMRQGVDANKDDQVVLKSRHYPPASDDPQQFTLLKFYELDAGAINLLLDGQTDNPDLPFTPGPKEHEIIHFSSEPKRSILLMGRSGTGKTTCLVFRMWAQFMAYEAEGAKPRQLFVTKNDVLRNEVEKSFLNMGLAWRRKNPSTQVLHESSMDTAHMEIEANPDSEIVLKFPLFLTSSEWLDILDRQLPGEHFFTETEIEMRLGSQNEDDAVQRGVEALFAEDEGQTIEQRQEGGRREMTFKIFREKWRRVNSRTKSNLDPALVWREIKSYIKGSIASLHLQHEERSQLKNRFLSLDEYVALPKKVSRLDEAHRRIVYELYQAYEKIKREGNYFDEMDLVYNLAGRVSLFLAAKDSHQGGGLLPIDSLFVDEVQDFTAAELYLLTKLSRDPNNLMLAGDTAQSITVGVGFRFTDVRQLFYEEFESIEPSLLQLTHNYRSHAGVLRLAACVVELLYFFFSDSLDRLPPDLGLLSGPSPMIMETQSAEELVLMLEGSKRETSRIEFGAHQVVIVRNEEARQSLPDEFGVDKDWVMTVQESKGLEFDDVLLYNFFTDSEAGDMWRVVCNYKEEDIAEYYKDISVKSSGVSSYEWNSLLDSKTRHLEFSREQHKILETELKMLYTAITRARINVYIAESDTERCKPMFEYFTKRGVVATTNSKQFDRPIFGKMSSTHDWFKRGEYYLLKAEGEGRKGRLRLAAKCFENAGETKRRDHALALLAFAEIEDQDLSVMKRRDKQAAVRRERLYTIAVQLLEARDTVFLNKAAYCLVQVGDEERLQGAEMFELYALICYSKRVRKNNAKRGGASKQEQEYFAYAAKFFERGAINNLLPAPKRRSLLIRSFQNYVRSGRKEDQESASRLLESNSKVLHRSFQELTRCEESQLDPLSSFNWKESQSIKNSMTNLARLACRSSHADDDPVAMTAALDAIPTYERIHMLSSLEYDPMQFVSATKWSSHSVYQKPGSLVDQPARKINVTSMLVDAYKKSGNYEKAAKVLEERGLLLEAAECLHNQIKEDCNEGTRHKLMCKSVELKARHVELVLHCPNWMKQRSHLESIFLQVKKSLESPDLSFQESLELSMALAEYKMFGGSPFAILEKCKKSPLWGYDAVMTVASGATGMEGLLSKRQTGDFWGNVRSIVRLVEGVGKIAASLFKPQAAMRAEDVRHQLEVEKYFDLQKYQFNPNQVSTLTVTNLKLRKAAAEENADGLLQTRKLVLQVGRDEAFALLGRHLYRRAGALLLRLEEHLAVQAEKLQPCLSTKSGIKCKAGNRCKHSHSHHPRASHQHAEALQSRIVCLEQMLDLRRDAEVRCPGFSLGKSLYNRRKENCGYVAKELAKHLLTANHMKFKVVSDEYVEKEQDQECIVWRRSSLRSMTFDAHNRWHYLPGYKQKECLIEVMRYWRLLQFCDENNNPSSRIEQELHRVEKKKKSKEEGSSKKKVDHFISSTDLRLFSRMWIWAVDSVKDDLFQAITIVEQLITRTTNSENLWTLHKSDQISLLECNALAIFSALSLRYSAGQRQAWWPTARKNHWWLIPKRSYLNCYLKAEGCSASRGFGVPVQEVIENACHKHFFECFQTCVHHLEWIAYTIVKNGLLRYPKAGAGQPEDYVRLERAIILGFFVSANAVLFSLAGKDMSPQQAQQELNNLPSLPLSGNINTLTKTLRATVVGCKITPRLHNAFSGLKETPKFLDLLQATNSLLSLTGWQDKFVLCRLSKDGKDLVETNDNTDQIGSKLRSVPFREDQGLFLRQSKPSCRDFLPVSVEQVEEITIRNVSEMSRKSDERKAATTILRYLRSWQHQGEVQAPGTRNPIKFFRSWKQTMCIFIKLAQEKMAHIRLEKAKAPPSPILQATDQGFCPLNSLPDHFIDAQHCQSSMKRWSAMLDSYDPVFDGIECSYCGQTPSQQARAERKHWCRTNFPNLTYRDASIQYNMTWCGTPEAPFETNYGGISFFQHSYDGFHQHQRKVHQMHKEALTQVAVALDNAFLAVNRIIGVCDSQYGHPYAASWYLNMGEQARIMLKSLEDSHGRLFYEAVHWPPNANTINELLDALKVSSRGAQNFFSSLRDEELRQAREQQALKENGSNDNDVEFVAPIVGLP